MKLIFATNNENKLKEIRSIFSGDVEIISLKEAGIERQIDEPYNTLEENATEKSRVIFELTNTDCFSEDTGLEVDALNGEPGVKSARYAGDDATSEENIDKLLNNLAEEKNRKARFRTIISLIMQGKEYQFEGICEGGITTERTGSKGFGYDPVFIPSGSEKSFAEMDMDEKNKFSHRKKAFEKLINFIKHIEK